MDGVEKAVEFINKKVETIDLKAIEKSNAALAGGKSEGYNGSASMLDEAIYKNWYGDEWHPPATGAGNYSGKLYSGTRNPYVDFTNKKGNSTLKTHFDDHASDFGYATEAAYKSGSRYFLEKPPTSTTQSFVTKDGTYFRYDTATNEFGIMNKYGGVSTYFKPITGSDYWYDQISIYALK